MIKQAVLFLFVALAGCSKTPDATSTPDSGATATTPTPTTAPAPTPSATPTPSAAAKSGDLTCEKDDDCVVLRAQGCCPSPCPAGVSNKRDRDRVESELAIACGKQAPHPCPSAGACRTNAILCENKKCGIFYEGDPGYRARKP